MDLLRVIIAILLPPLGDSCRWGSVSTDNLANTLIIRIRADHREIRHHDGVFHFGISHTVKVLHEVEGFSPYGFVLGFDLCALRKLFPRLGACLPSNL
jgi:hypothetical protein